MKPRRRIFPGFMDPLIGTMTNAVGILVILLVVAQFGVGDAIKRIRGAADSFTPQDLEQLRAKATETHRITNEQRAQHAEMAPKLGAIGESVTEANKKIAETKREIESLQGLQQEKRAIEESIQGQKQRLEQTLGSVKDRQVQLANVQKEIAAIGPVEEKPPTIVHVPYPREAPILWKPLTFYCRNGRIVRFDQGLLLSRAQDTIKKSPLGRKQAGRIECEQLLTLFEMKDVSNGYFRLIAEVADDAPRFKVQFKDGVGETVESIQNARSSFEQLARRIEKQNEYVQFYVWPDSFEVYHLAREIIDKAGVAAGWKLFDMNEEAYIDLVDLRGERVFCEGYREPPAGDGSSGKSTEQKDSTVDGRERPELDVID